VESAVFLEQDMCGPVRLELPRGVASAFSSARPGRDGPNEDAAAVWGLAGGPLVLAVADGLGGQRSGAQASRIALERLGDELGADGPEVSAVRASILDGFEGANRAVLELGGGAGTTLAVAEVHQDTLRPYHVGDSAILVTGQRGKLKLLTVAHSPVGYAVEAGVLDAEEAMHHEDRHYVSNHVGAPDMRIEVGSARQLSPRDSVLLASDGLLDNLTIPEIVALIRTGSVEDAAERLVSLVRERMHAPGDASPSKPDDVTFILYRPVG
jgi:serine/threonine protein phosphatase PrpC